MDIELKVSDLREVFVAIWNIIVTVFCQEAGLSDEVKNKYLR